MAVTVAAVLVTAAAAVCWGMSAVKTKAAFVAVKTKAAFVSGLPWAVPE
jgi:hypothetical protein